MPNSDLSIKWFDDRLGKVTYSMDNRRGQGNPPSFDCSSSQYYSLIQGGYFPVGIYIGSTETLFNDLEKYGWQQVQPNAAGNYDTQRNDIFIWGTRGRSGGGNGHTGRFEDANVVIHCSAGYNGIARSDYDWLHKINGWPTATYYRYVGGQVIANNPTDQIVEIGSYIRFNSIFRVDEVRDIADIWQVRTGVLCPTGFTWADNGIPAAPLVEVDVDGYATPDQSFDTGSRYVIPGKFQVLDVGQSGNRWLAQIQSGQFKFWVDLETATEVDSNDPGTSLPQSRPQATTTTTTVLLEKPNGTISQDTNPSQTGVTTTSSTTTTTATPQPFTTSTTTIFDDETLASIDLETDGAPSTRPPVIAGNFTVGFWKVVGQFFITLFNRLRGVK